MMRYLACYEVKENDWRLDDICDGSVTFQSSVNRAEERRFMREDQLLAKLISSSLSCTLARQVVRFDYESEMWEYMAKRFEGSENATTKLYTQRTLRQKLEGASCRPGADVENHLLYMLSLREQLAALDADVSDVWMVDLMVRTMSQFSYYSQLQTLMLLGGTQTVSTPDEAKAMILILDKNALVERQLNARRNTDPTCHSGHPYGGGDRSGGNGGGRCAGGGAGGRGVGGGGGKPMPNYQNRSQNSQSRPHGANGGNTSGSGHYKKRSDQDQQQYEEDRSNRNCYGCHQPGHIRRNCPNEVKQEPERYVGDNGGNARSQANVTFSSGAICRAQQVPTQEQQGRDSLQGAHEPDTVTNKPSIKPVYRPEQWVFDNGATQHLVGDRRYFVNFRNLTREERENATVYGYNGESSPVGVGSIDLWVIVEGLPVVLRVDNVYYSPDKTNLFSQSVATEQGFQIGYDDITREYTLSMNGEVAMKIKVHPCKLWIFKAENAFLSEQEQVADLPTPQSMVNYSMSDGVADLQCWHERLGHICPQFVKQISDQDLVEGMMLRNRKFDLCEACQLGKQKEKTPQRHLDRGVKRRNQLVCVDLLFPPSHYNCTRFKAILVLLDAHTRYVTAYPVQTKYKDEINPLMRRYCVWAERQWPDCKVQEVLTDGGGEFVNGVMTAWYLEHGIMHTPTPPNTSRLNMVERTHQTLTGMMKAMMKDSGFPTSFWVEALHYAVHIKNRTFSSATSSTPYEEMWGRKPDIHHIRKFGALAYVHTKVGPSRHKFADNCRIGFVLGYRDGMLGCKVYFPSEGTVQVAGQVTVNEQIMYKDRHNDGFDRRIRDWAIAEHPDLTSAGRRDYDLPVVGGGSGGGDDSPDSSERSSAAPRSDGAATANDGAFPGEGTSSGTPTRLQRPLPNLSDDVVLHPENNSGAQQRRGGLVEVVDPDDEDIGLEELQVYAAFAAIAMITEAPKPQKRVWHISEVQTPRTVPQAMNSPQRAEWWKGMEKEISAMIEKMYLSWCQKVKCPTGPNRSRQCGDSSPKRTDSAMYCDFGRVCVVVETKKSLV